MLAVTVQTFHCVCYQETDRARVHGASVKCSIKTWERNFADLTVNVWLCWLSKLCHMFLEQATSHTQLWPVWDQNISSKWGWHCSSMEMIELKKVFLLILLTPLWQSLVGFMPNGIVCQNFGFMLMPKRCVLGSRAIIDISRVWVVSNRLYEMKTTQAKL